MKKIILFLIGIALLATSCNKPQTTIKSQVPVVALDFKPVQSPKPNPPTPVLPLHTVGQITRHTAGFINQQVRIQGYLLKKEADYIIFSDESGGAISQYDLPVVGSGIEIIQPNRKYELRGIFLDHGLNASNGSPNHLELLITPQLIR
jgi:hypothetical protein